MSKIPLVFTLLSLLYASPYALNAQEIPFDVHMASKAAIADYAVSRAMIYGVDQKLVLSIIKAESDFNKDAKNSSSTASGLAQFLNGSFKYLCMDTYGLTDTILDKNEPHIQIECLIKTIKDGGVYHWSASKSIWSKLLTTM